MKPLLQPHRISSMLEIMFSFNDLLAKSCDMESRICCNANVSYAGLSKRKTFKFSDAPSQIAAIVI